MKLQLPKNETSVILVTFIQDSSSAVGAGLAGLSSASSITGGYVKRDGTGVALAVDEAVATPGTYQAPTTAGQVRIGTPVNMPTGFYEFHFHNDLFTTSDYVVIGVDGAANMVPLGIEVQLTTADLNQTIATAIENADALLDRVDGIEAGWTLRGVLRIISAGLAGKVSGAENNAPVFMNLTGTKIRISATTDDDGNRITIVLDGTDV